MSWVIVGNSEQATFACDTSMAGFGPLLQEYGETNAADQLRQFAEELDGDPRELHIRGHLRDEFTAWLQE